LLLVDVDGVVSLFGFAHLPPAGLLPTVVECVPHLLSAHAGPLLARLSDSFERVWAAAGTGPRAEHVSVLERWARRL